MIVARLFPEIRESESERRREQDPAYTVDSLFFHRKKIYDEERMMEGRPRRIGFLWFTGIGATLGALLTTWLAPKVIAWYFNPPAQFGFNCVAPIEWALLRLQWAQVAGIGMGGIVGILAYFFLYKKRSEMGSAVSGH